MTENAPSISSKLGDMNKVFKVGDRVQINDNHWLVPGFLGEIIAIEPTNSTGKTRMNKYQIKLADPFIEDKNLIFLSPTDFKKFDEK